MTDTSGPPFRADHVGSLLRPQRLLDARARFAAGEIDAAELRGTEDEAIADVVRLQGDVGLRTATDGEFRRASWHMDFIYAIDGITKVTGEDIVVHFKNADGTIDFTPAGLHVDGPLSIDQPIFGADFAYLQGQVAATQTAKLTIPSPSMSTTAAVPRRSTRPSTPTRTPSGTRSRRPTPSRCAASPRRAAPTCSSTTPAWPTSTTRPSEPSSPHRAATPSTSTSATSGRSTLRSPAGRRA